MISIRPSLLLVVRLALLAALAAFGGLSPALAQNVVVMVNGHPITSFDIDQRTKLTQMTTRKTPSRQEVIDELIDERIKIQAGQRFRLEITDQDVDNSFAEMGKRMRLSPQQLTATLGQSGIEPGTLKNRIRADLSWQNIVRGKFQSSFQIREKDVLAAAKQKQAGDQPLVDKVTDTEYALRPILFVVPKGEGGASMDSRKRDAEAFRARFQGCETGLPLARQLRDVAVRDQIVKTGSELGPALREILDRTGVDKLTTPEATPNGVEMFALCSKKEIKVEAAALKEARQQIFMERFQRQSKKYLQELRRGAMIEMK